MPRRKPVLLVDDTVDSTSARELLNSAGIEYVEYHIKKFEESCCGDLPTTRAPSVFAPTGLFRGLEGINQFVIQKKNTTDERESESAYW